MCLFLAMVNGKSLLGRTPVEVVEMQPEPYRSAILSAGLYFKFYSDEKAFMPTIMLVQSF